MFFPTRKSYVKRGREANCFAPLHQKCNFRSSLAASVCKRSTLEGEASLVHSTHPIKMPSLFPSRGSLLWGRLITKEAPTHDKTLPSLGNTSIGLAGPTFSTNSGPKCLEIPRKVLGFRWLNPLSAGGIFCRGPEATIQLFPHICSPS